MSVGHRVAIVLLIAAGTLTGVGLVLFATNACSGPTDIDPCASAAVNRGVVVALAAAAAGLIVTPFALLAEYATRRRIVYRGAWSRAARRGAVVAIVIAVLAGLRLGGALSAPLAAAVVFGPIALELYLSRTELRGGPAG